MVHPRPASTVVLVRPDTRGRFEVLLTRRPETMRFLGGFYVFPGGTVHRDDYSAAMLARCRNLTGLQAAQILDGDHEAGAALGHWIAVARELFEEVGILLCVDERGAAFHPADAARARRIEQTRQSIANKQLQFADFLASENLYCDLALPIYFDHWVTPEIYSMRFDTRFYLAVLPANQAALETSEEVTHSVWIHPSEALSRINRRDFPILPPTTTVLGELSRLSSWDQLCRRFELP